MTLVQVLMASALLAMVAAGAMQLMGGMNRDMASLASRGDVEEVRQAIRRRLSCKQSFPTAVCAPGANGLVWLKDNFGQNLFTDIEPGTAPGKGVFANTFRYGSVRIQTTCGPGSVQIRMARFSDPKTAWPTKPTVETCQEVLGGVFNNLCPPGWDMRGINEETLEPVCVPAAYSCPIGQYLAGVSYDVNGSPVPTCRTIAVGCGNGAYQTGTTFDPVTGNMSAVCQNFTTPSCPTGFVKSVDIPNGAYTCSDANDGSRFGGLFVVVGGPGAGDNPALPATSCPPGVLGLITPCACYTRNTTNPAYGCGCPPGFTTEYTNALFDASAGLNWGGGFGCTSQVGPPTNGTGCGWAMGFCHKSF